MIHRMRTAAIGGAGLEAGTNQTCPKARHRVPSTVYKATTPLFTSFLRTPIISSSHRHSDSCLEGSRCTRHSAVLHMGPDNHGYPSCSLWASTFAHWFSAHSHDVGGLGAVDIRPCQSSSPLHWLSATHSLWRPSGSTRTIPGNSGHLACSPWPPICTLGCGGLHGSSVRLRPGVGAPPQLPRRLDDA